MSKSVFKPVTALTRGVRLTVVAVFAVLAGCTKPPTLPALGADATVVAFGDSLTSGRGASAGADYPSVLAGMIGRNVINAGVPGELSAAGVDRLPGVLDRHAPELLVLIHGGNDMLRKLPREQTRANLAAMSDLAFSRGIDVVLLGVPEPGLLLHSADLYEELAEQRKLPIDTEILPEVLSDRHLKSDTVHPNDAGYRRIAEALFRLLSDSGAL